MTRKQKQQTSTPQLNWLFSAFYDDDTVIEQDQLDKSQNRTDGTGSRYSDVLAKDGLIGFGLTNNDGHKVFVDLMTGNFVVNGLPVCLHNQSFDPTKYKLELVYFRETRFESIVGDDGQEIGQKHYVNRTFIGWKTTVLNKEKQVTLAVG